MFQFFEGQGYTLWTQNYLGDSFKDCGIYCLKKSSKLLYEETQFLKLSPIYDGLKLFNPGLFLNLVKSLNNNNFQTYQKYVRLNRTQQNGNLLFAHAIIPHPLYIVRFMSTKS